MLRDAHLDALLSMRMPFLLRKYVVAPPEIDRRVSERESQLNPQGTQVPPGRRTSSPRGPLRTGAEMVSEAYNSLSTVM
jgi:hypothetical protein